MNGLTVTMYVRDGRCSAWLLPPWGAEYAQQCRTGGPSQERVLTRILLDTLSVGYNPKSRAFDLTGVPMEAVTDPLRRLGVAVHVR